MKKGCTSLSLSFSDSLALLANFLMPLCSDCSMPFHVATAAARCSWSCKINMPVRKFHWKHGCDFTRKKYLFGNNYTA